MKRDPAKARAWQQRSAERATENRREKFSATARHGAQGDHATGPHGFPLKHRACRAPIRKRNQKRLAERRLEQFGTPEQTAMINAMSCCCSEAPRPHPACTGGWSDPSHIVSRAAGGTIRDQVPMSRGCHNAWHQHGQDAYLEEIGWTPEQLRAAADRTYAIITGDGMRAEAPW